MKAVTMNARRILYVDSDPAARLLMSELLAPHDVDVAADDLRARSCARTRSYDVYILSGGGPDSSALPLCAWLHRVDPRTPILFCSSNGTAQYQQLAVTAGALRYHLKPIDPKMLRATVGLLLKIAELESVRAMAAVEQAIADALLHVSRIGRAPAAAARDKAEEAMRAMLRMKAYRAFRSAGGNRANFERMWPQDSAVHLRGA